MENNKTQKAQVIDVNVIADVLAKKLSKEKDVWEDYVPIIETDDKLHIYLTEGIDLPSIYNETYHRILHTRKDTFVYINNGGGVIDSAVLLSDAIYRTQAKVTAVLSGTVASAATMITMRCDEITIAPFTQFMIHNYSGGVHGKGKEAKDQMDFVNAELEKTFKEIYEGFLTPEELEDVIDDHDIWMGRDEVLERWENKVKQSKSTDLVEDIIEKTE